jgi:hypothetical protein
VSVPAESSFAWEPVTPRGVAAFAHASFERLLFVQFLVALLATASVVWLLDDGCCPTVNAAIGQLPASGGIHSGKLDWPDASPKLLAEGRFLAFVVDLKHSGQIRSPAQFQVEFGRESVRVFSLFGEAEFNYASDRGMPFNQPELEPLWGAWKPDLLAIAALATFFGLLLSWAVLATIYFLPVWLVCFFANRDLNFRRSWKLAAAVLLPGALMMTAAILCYESGGFDLVQLCFAFGMHFVLGWIYLLVSPMFLRRPLPAEKRNPFSSARQAAEDKK